MNLFSYLNGCCEFSASGYFPERFLNLAARADLGLWDIHRIDSGISAKITARRYKQLRPLARKCGIRLKIIRKYGLPFRLLPYRRRAGMPLGFLIFCGMIFLLSQFYWIVETPQVSPALQPKLDQAIYAAGIRPGVLRSQVDAAMIAKELQLELSELSWAGITTSGSCISVDVREMERFRQELAGSEPCNVVAARDGIIISVKAAEGLPEVSAGQAVAEGDLLISGVIELGSGDVSMVHAQGEVMAASFYSFSSEADFDSHRTERTGRMITIRRLMLLGIEIPLYIGSNPEGEFEREYEEWQLTAAGTRFPLTVRTERWYELRTVNRIIDRQEAEEMVRADIAEQLKVLDGLEIISQTELLEETDTGVCLKTEVTVKQDIALKELILFE